MAGEPGYSKSSDLWLLPDGVEELRHAEALHVENLRRKLLDLYDTWGYELVMPPLVEYLESLLTGVGRDLELQTFKLTDQLTGRLMGVRADMTPQAARIDARSKTSGSNRLCYIGSVLRTKAPDMLASRSPIQAGCELFGVNDVAADIEVICLMLETLRVSGVKTLHLDLSHMGVYNLLLDRAKLSEADASQLYKALRLRSTPDIDALLDRVSQADVRAALRALPELIGGVDVLEDAAGLFADFPQVSALIVTMREVVEVVSQRYPGVEICIDLCEMRGYRYHTGIVFAAYAEGLGQAIAQGGRYDNIGEEFGTSRPATGFSADLKSVLRVIEKQQDASSCIVAPAGQDPALWQAISDLRKRGERVVQVMPGESISKFSDCSERQLTLDTDGCWVLAPIN